MQAMVSKGIVHRDLKPQNILLSHDGRTKNPHPQDITLKVGNDPDNDDDKPFTCSRLLPKWN